MSRKGAIFHASFPASEQDLLPFKTEVYLHLSGSFSCCLQVFEDCVYSMYKSTGHCQSPVPIGGQAVGERITQHEKVAG